MTAAASVARYLLSEASSGTSPTTTADDTGNGNALDIDYSSGDAEWTSVAAGNGLDFTATENTANTAVAVLSDIVNNGNIGSSLLGTKEAWMIIAVDNIVGSSSRDRVFAVGTDGGNTDISIVKDGPTDTWDARWDRESGGSDRFIFTATPSASGTVDVIIIQFDTNQALAADGQKAWFNGTPLTITSAAYTQNAALDDVNNINRSISIGNRPNADRNIKGQMYYAELGTGILTTQQITDISTNILLDNDSSPLPAPPAGGRFKLINGGLINTNRINNGLVR